MKYKVVIVKQNNGKPLEDALNDGWEMSHIGASQDFLVYTLKKRK